MEYHRDRNSACCDIDCRIVLAGHVCEGNAVFTYRRLCQRYCGSVPGCPHLADQRNESVSGISSGTSGLAGHARISALQPCHLCLRGALQCAIPGVLCDVESLLVRDAVQPSVRASRANLTSLIVLVRRAKRSLAYS